MITDHTITVVIFSNGKIVVSPAVGFSSRLVMSPVIGMGLVTLVSSVVAMSRVTEKKCSSCCELSNGSKAPPGRWCEWGNGGEVE